MDNHPESNNLYVTGGVDKTAVIFDHATEKKVCACQFVSGIASLLIFRLLRWRDIPRKLAVCSSIAIRTLFLLPLTTRLQESGRKLHPDIRPLIRFVRNSNKQREIVDVMLPLQIAVHTSAVTDLDLHPLKDYIATSSSDGTWSFHDIRTGVSLARLEAANGLCFDLCCDERLEYRLILRLQDVHHCDFTRTVCTLASVLLTIRLRCMI